MTRPSHHRSSERSRWLSSLSAALAEAQGVLAALDEEAAQSAEAHHLKARIAAIRSEVELLRRGGFPSLKEVAKKPPNRPRWPGWNR
jgi:cell division protein FtsB